MKIELSKYTIETDSLNYTLSEKKLNKESGKEYSTVIGYYPNFEQVIKKLLNLKIKESEEIRLNELSTWFKLMNEYIKETLTEVKSQIGGELSE